MHWRAPAADLRPNDIKESFKLSNRTNKVRELGETMQRMPDIIANRERKSPAAAWVSKVLMIFMVLVPLLCRSAAAQGIQQFVGHIADSSGAAVPGATVTIHNEETGVNVVVKSTGVGDYTAPYLKPGTYTITAGMAGLRRSARPTSACILTKRPRWTSCCL